MTKTNETDIWILGRTNKSDEVLYRRDDDKVGFIFMFYTIIFCMYYIEWWGQEQKKNK